MAKQELKELVINVVNTYQYLQALNSILNLTSKELKILTAFIDLSETIDLCSVHNKKIVAKALEIEDYNTLNNYVKRLKDKKVIVKTKDGYIVSKLIQPDEPTVLKIQPIRTN